MTLNFTLFHFILYPLLFTFLSLLIFTCLLLIHHHLHPLPTPLISYRFNHSESPSFPYPTSRSTLSDSAYSSVLKMVAPNSSKVLVLLHQLDGIKPRRQLALVNAIKYLNNPLVKVQCTFATNSQTSQESKSNKVKQQKRNFQSTALFNH